MKPLLKWVGGKTQILDAVVGALAAAERAPDGTYYEPFVGGGSVLLAALERGVARGRVVASDANARLIHFYQSVQSDPEAFLRDVAALLDGLDAAALEARYYAERARFNDAAVPWSAARFWFLNKTCFRGMYRTGRNGFNVPFGHGAVPTCSAEHVRAVAAAIQRVEFRCCDYADAVADARAGDLVYLDPPYVPVSATSSFVGYTEGGFGAAEHARLFEACKALPCAFVMSNADVPAVTDAFAAYRVERVGVRRAIHAKQPGTRMQEVIVSK